jgi:hypothetical protein
MFSFDDNIVHMFSLFTYLKKVNYFKFVEQLLFTFIHVEQWFIFHPHFFGSLNVIYIICLEQQFFLILKFSFDWCSCAIRLGVSIGLLQLKQMRSLWLKWSSL